MDNRARVQRAGAAQERIRAVADALPKRFGIDPDVLSMRTLDAQKWPEDGAVLQLEAIADLCDAVAEDARADHGKASQVGKEKKALEAERDAARKEAESALRAADQAQARAAELEAEVAALQASLKAALNPPAPAVPPAIQAANAALSDAEIAARTGGRK